MSFERALSQLSFVQEYCSFSMDLSLLGLMESEQDAFRKGGNCFDGQMPDVSDPELF
jgi:hypothetical protein